MATSRDNFAEQFQAFVGSLSDEQLKSLQDIMGAESERRLERSRQQAAEQPAVKAAPEPEKGGNYSVYVDGSYDPKSGSYAYGMVVLKPGAEPEFFKKAFPKDEFASQRNVAGEVMGASAALRLAQDRHADSVLITHDYSGLGSKNESNPGGGWADGSWRAKNPYTKAYQALVAETKDRGINVDFHRVDGHTGVKWNEKCDELAKDALGLEPSKDPKVRAAGAYVSSDERFKTVEQAMAHAYGVSEPGQKSPRYDF